MSWVKLEYILQFNWRTQPNLITCTTTCQPNLDPTCSVGFSELKFCAYIHVMGGTLSKMDPTGSDPCDPTFDFGKFWGRQFSHINWTGYEPGCSLR